ncbi:MAG: hypothetical protein ACQKBY_07970 [Verrucomicrobiales bacterium]
MRPFQVIFWLWLCVLTALTGEEEGIHALPGAPARFVLDEGGRLSASLRQELESSLAGFSLEDKQALYLAVLGEEPVQGGEAFAGILADHWRGAPFVGVLIYVPGREGGVWGALGGEARASLIGAKEAQEAVRRAASFATRESEEEDQLRVGLDQLRKEMSFARLRTQRVDEAKSRIIEGRGEEWLHSEWRKRAVLLALAVGMLFLALFVFLLFFYLRRRKRPVTLPETTPSKRLQGPWSGGGNAYYDFSHLGE